MKRILAIIVPCCAVLAVGAPARAGETLALEQLPPEVQEAVRKHVQNRELVAIEREQQVDKPVYEVEFTAPEGNVIVLEIEEDGDLIRQRGRLN